MQKQSANTDFTRYEFAPRTFKMSLYFLLQIYRYLMTEKNARRIYLARRSEILRFWGNFFHNRQYLRRIAAVVAMGVTLRGGSA